MLKLFSSILHLLMFILSRRLFKKKKKNIKLGKRHFYCCTIGKSEFIFENYSFNKQITITLFYRVEKN